LLDANIFEGIRTAPFQSNSKDACSYLACTKASIRVALQQVRPTKFLMINVGNCPSLQIQTIYTEEEKHTIVIPLIISDILEEPEKRE
jgi:hypothetical protein